MFRLFVHQDAIADLEQLWTDNPTVAARITVLLEEAIQDQDLLDRLTQDNFGRRGRDKINVSGWYEQWNRGNNLWRLKLWDLEGMGLQFRVVYAFIPAKKHYHVLGIAPRNFDYDPNHDISKRIVAAYKQL